MKRVNVKKVLYCVLIAICAIASFCGGISYSISHTEADVQEEIVYESPDVIDEDLISYSKSEYLDSFITKKEDNVEEETKTVTAKEDPNAVKKKLEEEKGVAKVTSASQSIQKYETNETSIGIDVSYAQGKIDWTKVKEAGIKFAIIRVGFRGWGSGKLVVDSKFYDNMKGAIANDINVGVYFFTAATNEDEAREEAQFVINLIKDYDISYPVVYDTELFNDTYKPGSEEYGNYRLKYTSDAQLTNNAIVFSSTIKNAGYTPMIYASKNPLTNRFETTRFGDTRIWVAQYNDTITYEGKYHMWQYTSKGNVPGINGYVDMNVSYFSVTTDASKQSSVTGVLNDSGLGKVIFTDCYYPTTSISTETIRSTPYTNLPNKAGTLNSGSSIIVTGINSDWVRFSYNGDTFYVNNVNFYKKNGGDFNSLNISAVINKDIDLYVIPYVNDSNYSKKINNGSSIIVLGKNDSFTKISFDGGIYYVNDISDFYSTNLDDSFNNSSSDSV